MTRLLQRALFAAATTMLLACALVVAPAVLGRASADPGPGGVEFLMINPQKVHLDLPGVQVRMRRIDDGDIVTGTTDATGRVTFTGIPAGSWDATFRPPDAGAATRIQVSVMHVPVPTGRSIYQGVVLGIGGWIGGTLRSSGGAELSGAAVVARSVSDPTISRTAMTDAHGHFWVRGLAGGDYSLQYNARVGSPLPYQTRYETWSFWGAAPGTAWSGKTVHAVNGTAGNVQSSADGCDGTVLDGQPLTTIIRPQGSTDFTHGTVTYTGEGIGSTFTFPVTSGSATNGAVGGALVIAGRYTVSVTGVTPTGASVTYYYTGETTPPSTTAASAAWVYFHDAPKSITLIRTT